MTGDPGASSDPGKPKDVLRRVAKKLEGGKKQAVLALAPKPQEAAPRLEPRPEGSDEPSPPTPAVPTTDELVAAVAQAQGALREAAEKGGMRHDPVRYMLAAFSDVLGVLIKTTRRWEGCVADVIAARQPFPTEQRVALVEGVIAASRAGAREGGQVGAREEARRLVRGLDRATSVRVGLYVGGALVAGVALGCALTLAVGGWFRSGPFDPTSEAVAAWREIAQNNPDPTRTLEGARMKVDPATGRRYREGVSLWVDPVRPPPASAAK